MLRIETTGTWLEMGRQLAREAPGPVDAHEPAVGGAGMGEIHRGVRLDFGQAERGPIQEDRLAVLFEKHEFEGGAETVLDFLGQKDRKAQVDMTRGPENSVFQKLDHLRG